MPQCAVIWCHNYSQKVNKQNSNVTYHRFPNDPCTKEKWMLATGKYDWFPQKYDTICSDHFEASSFTKRSSTCTRLSLEAIPTLKLHPFINEVSSIERNKNQAISVTDPTSVVTVEIKVEPEEDMIPITTFKPAAPEVQEIRVEQPYPKEKLIVTITSPAASPNPLSDGDSGDDFLFERLCDEGLRKRVERDAVCKKKMARRIKTLLGQNRRLKKAVANLKSRLKAVNNNKESSG